MGNAVREAEQLYTQNDGGPYAQLTVACNTYGGEEQDGEIHFFNKQKTERRERIRHERDGERVPGAAPDPAAGSRADSGESEVEADADGTRPRE